jgi:hypothetical protein
MDPKVEGHPASSSRAKRGRGLGRTPLCGRVVAMTTRRKSVSDHDAQRAFSCIRCSALVFVCARCDRGNEYCGPNCAKEARRASQRAANRRYQATPRGRQLHAARQARYQQRRCQQAKMTEQGSPTAALGVQERQTPIPRCRTCSTPLIGFVRYRFIRRPNRLKSRPRGPFFDGFR